MAKSALTVRLAVTTQANWEDSNDRKKLVDHRIEIEPPREAEKILAGGEKKNRVALLFKMITSADV